MCYSSITFYCGCVRKVTLKCSSPRFGMFSGMMKAAAGATTDCDKHRSTSTSPTTCGRSDCESMYPNVPRRPRDANRRHKSTFTHTNPGTAERSAPNGYVLSGQHHDCHRRRASEAHGDAAREARREARRAERTQREHQDRRRTHQAESSRHRDEPRSHRHQSHRHDDKGKESREEREHRHEEEARRAAREARRVARGAESESAAGIRAGREHYEAVAANNDYLYAQAQQAQAQNEYYTFEDHVDPFEANQEYVDSGCAGQDQACNDYTRRTEYEAAVQAAAAADEEAMAQYNRFKNNLANLSPEEREVQHQRFGAWLQGRLLEDLENWDPSMGVIGEDNPSVGPFDLDNELNQAERRYAEELNQRQQGDYRPVTDYHMSALPQPLASASNRMPPPPAPLKTHKGSHSRVEFDPDAPVRSSSKREHGSSKLKSSMPPSSSSKSHKYEELKRSSSKPSSSKPPSSSKYRESRGRDWESRHDGESSKHRSSSTQRSSKHESSKHHSSSKRRELSRERKSSKHSSAMPSRSDSKKGKSTLGRIRDVVGRDRRHSTSSNLSFGCVDSNRIAAGGEANPTIYRGNSHRKPSHYINGTDDVIYGDQGMNEFSDDNWV